MGNLQGSLVRDEAEYHQGQVNKHQTEGLNHYLVIDEKLQSVSHRPSLKAPLHQLSLFPLNIKLMCYNKWNINYCKASRNLFPNRASWLRNMATKDKMKWSSSQYCQWLLSQITDTTNQNSPHTHAHTLYSTYELPSISLNALHTWTHLVLPTIAIIIPTEQMRTWTHLLKIIQLRLSHLSRSHN